jgi:hypothetical protein
VGGKIACILLPLSACPAPTDVIAVLLCNVYRGRRGLRIATNLCTEMLSCRISVAACLIN